MYNGELKQIFTVYFITRFEIYGTIYKILNANNIQRLLKVSSPELASFPKVNDTNYMKIT